MDVTPDILATIVSFFSTIIVLIISQFAMARWFDKKIIDFRTELKGDIADTRMELKGDIANTRAELKGDMANFRTELKGDMADLHTELKGDIENNRTELNGSLADLRMELKSDIADTRMELKGDIKLVQQKSEEAHKEINGRLNVLIDKVHDLDKGLSTLKATVDCIDDKVDSIQRRLDDAKL